MDTSGDDDDDPLTGTAAHSASPTGAAAGPSQPRPIRKLTQDVVNRIAAAEIIHRPSNAVKELLENALDAGATSIRVSVKEGGLKLLQITDNGHGINRADLALLCERYATSKLEQFEDLQSLATYGFRGEALASVSYCSHLEVVTKTRSDSCGWKAQYDSGELVSEPRPTAANDGTVISAEDLFYNMPLRKRAFRSAADEYGRILDVVTKYAVHNPQTAWVCKKAGTALSEVSTSAGSTSRANIALLYTSSLASELLEVPLTHFAPKLGASVHGWVSNANSNWARKGGWILFINNRLVESTKIKKAIDGLYTAFLARGASPFCYLSLHIDPANVDVNVHPTKSEVHFLHEDEIVDAVVAAVDKALANANASRSFTVQTLLPGAEALRRRVSDDSDDDDDDDSRGRRRPGPSQSQSQRNGGSNKPAPNYKVRIDPANRTLDSMVTIVHPSQISAYDERSSKRRGVGDGDEEVQLIDDGEDANCDETPMWNTTQPASTAAERQSKEIPESSCDFESVVELRRQVRKRASPELIETMSKHSFVGVVDRRSCLALIQHATKLLLVNYAALGDEHFYQLGLRQFGALGRLRLEPKPKLADLLRIAAEDEEHGIEANGLTVDAVVKKATALLLSKHEMVDEYFSLSISASGAVESIPLLLKGYTPNLDRLPHFLLCLATRVDWTGEQECFETFLRELAFFYSPRPFDDNDEEEGENEAAAETSDEVAHDLWQLEHVVFPSLRRTQWPPTLSEHDVRQVANLPSLYRVFERC